MGSGIKLSNPGFTIIEVLLAFTILALVLMTFYLTSGRALLLSETNRQIKTALLDAENVVEEIQGAPFDLIMNPGYPSPAQAAPRFPHLQTTPLTHLPNEQLRVWYGHAPLFVGDPTGSPDSSDVTVAGNPNPLIINANGTVTFQHAKRENVAKALPLVPGSQTVLAMYPVGAQAFDTPDPLYVTVEVSWTGPSGSTMYQRITTVRSR